MSRMRFSALETPGAQTPITMISGDGTSRSLRWRIGAATTVAILGGGSLAIVLLAYYGFGAVGSQILAVGWQQFLVIGTIQAAVLALAGIAWWLLMPRRDHALWPVVGARLIREAGSELLPFSAVGGYLMSARVLAVQGVWGPSGMASLIVDVTLEIASQIAFAVIALGILVWSDGHSYIAPVVIGLVIALGAIAGAYALQRGNIDILWGIVRPLVGGLLGRGFQLSKAVQRQIDAIYRDHWRASVGFLVHLGCWISSAAEIWLALKFMGVTLDVASVIALEGLVSAINGAAFVVPNAIGVQEGAYVALGAIFGLDPESALALSLLKRGRDLLVGLPSLLLWQAIEAKWLWRRRSGSPHHLPQSTHARLPLAKMPEGPQC